MRDRVLEVAEIVSNEVADWCVLLRVKTEPPL
jgi:hypothetical protein